MFANTGTRITLNGDDYAYCQETGKAVMLLNDARRLNDKRKYTESAKTIYKAEQLSGFRYLHPIE